MLEEEDEEEIKLFFYCDTERASQHVHKGSHLANLICVVDKLSATSKTKNGEW